MGLVFRAKPEPAQAPWEERSGFLHFVSDLQRAVQTFEERLGFDLEIVAEPVREVDGDPGRARTVAHVVIRKNPVFGEKTYCLVTRFDGEALQGTIGFYADGAVTTLRPVGVVTDFHQPGTTVYDWLKALVKASCDK